MSEPAWIEHDGSAVCPVPAGHDVEVEYRNRRKARAIIGAKDCAIDCDAWKNDGLSWDVTRYRDWTAFEQQQASAGEVPEWAGERAFDLVAEARGASDGCWAAVRHLPHYQAFARYIAAHEPAPVDPVQRLAAEICAKLRGTGSSAAMVKEVEAMLRARVTVAKGGE